MRDFELHAHLIGAPDSRRRLTPPHCDPTVNLYDTFLVAGNVLEALWPVSARGASR